MDKKGCDVISKKLAQKVNALRHDFTSSQYEHSIPKIFEHEKHARRLSIMVFPFIPINRNVHGGSITRSEIIFELRHHLDVVAFSDRSVKLKNNIYFYYDNYFRLPRIAPLEPFAWFISILYYLIVYAIRRCKAMVITVPSEPHHTLFALLASAIFNIPVVSIVLGYPFKYRKYHIDLILAQLAWSRIVVFTTRKLGRHYRQLGFIPKLSVVVYSVNPISRSRVRTDISRSAARKVLHLPMEKKMVLTIGRYTVFKNLEDFCKACKKLKRTWADRLLIEIISASGDPKYEAHIKDLIQEIPNSVILDNVPYETVLLHIRSADCIVLTSKIDNYSRALLEGLANHVPVVTYDAGLEELLDLSIDQSHGLYTVRTGSIDDLTCEINRVLVSDEPVSTYFDLPIFTEQFVKNCILPLLQGLI